MYKPMYLLKFLKHIFLERLISFNATILFKLQFNNLIEHNIKLTQSSIVTPPSLFRFQ